LDKVKWRIAIIILVLTGTVSLFLLFRAPAQLQNDQTIQRITLLRQLSLNSAAEIGLSEAQRQNNILKIIHELEQDAEDTNANTSTLSNDHQPLLFIIALLVLFYISYILLQVLNHSNLIALSNSRIKAEIEKIQSTFSSIGDAVITTDSLALIDYMNEAAEELTNQKLSEIKNTPIQNIFKLFNDENYLLDDPVKRSIKWGVVEKAKYHVLLQRKGGEQIPIIYTIAPIHDSNSEIIGTIIVFHDTTETHKINKALSWQASHDSLTKLPNRVLLKDKLEKATEDAIMNDTLLTIFFIDLDNFKLINDLHGHSRGDKVLRIIAQRLLSTIRNDDLVARLGGDEFVITLLSFNHKDEIIIALNRIMMIISQPIPTNGHNLVLSASIGVSIFPEDNSDTDTLLRHADQAMYIAKQQGRNQYHFFDVQSNLVITKQESQRQRIEIALENNEFELLYQPKVNMRSGVIYGFEALIRWNHPEQGIILPDKFLPIAEKSHLIVKIGNWVIHRALYQLNLWQQQGLKFKIAINIAPKQFQEENFIDKLDQSLAMFAEIEASSIELEVLESAALQDTAKVSEVISLCHERNIKIALDDFGTGYASLSYLKQLPADQLKIDKSFIQYMLEDEGDRAIVEGIISLAQIFKREVIAEGVESLEHGVMLLRMGCDIAQGYAIAKPLHADEVYAWQQSWHPDPNWLLWSETNWDMSDFPLLIAHSDHFSGINNIVKTIQKSIDKQEIFELASEHHCRLGQWYYGPGMEKYGHLKCFKALEQPHSLAHKTGHEMLRLYAAGKVTEAQALIPQILQQRDEVLELLNQLQHKILLEPRT
jgi:diguanylate cyclase (GGDEF)-like protein/PAS domain S-box-containing protein